MNQKLPLVFACSGCSSAGQLANDLAVELNRRGAAEMSCLAGVGAGKSHFLKKLAGREVWVIDGCPIECSLGVFEQGGERVDVHIRLHDMGVRKNKPLPADRPLEHFVDEVLGGVAGQRRATRGGPSPGARWRAHDLRRQDSGRTD